MPLEIKVRAVPDTATFVSDLQKAADRLKLTIPVELNTATSQALNTAVESFTGGTTGQKVSGVESTNQQLREQKQLWDMLITSINRYNAALSLQKKGFSYPDLDKATALINSMNGVRTSEDKARGIEEGWINRDAIEDIATYKTQIEDLSRIMKDVNVAQNRYTRENSTSRSINAEATALKNLSRQMSDYMNANRNLINNRSGYSSLQELLNNVNTGQIDSSNARKQFSAIRAEMQALGLESETLGQRISKLFGDHFNTAIALAGINALQLGLQQLVVSVREVDAAMAELRKVTNLSDSGYDEFLTQASERAQQLGTSLSNVVSATADAAKLGYDLDEASSLADAISVYMNVGDNVESVDAASSSIISGMKAFNITAEESIGLVDRFNEVANRTSIDSGGIGEALQRSASALSAAGNTLDESIGLITAANDIQRNPMAVGTALKTVSMRLRSSKVELEEMGEDATGAAESVSKLREDLLALTGVDIMLDEDTYKSTFQILQEMSRVWDSLSDINQAGALELIAGQRQGNVVASLLTNFSEAERAAEISANSAGSAWQENEVYLDSINGKIGQFQASFQGLSTSILDSDVAKWFIDLGTAITQAMQSLTEFSGGPGWLIGGALGAFASFRDAGLFQVIDDPNTFSGKKFKNIFDNSISDNEIKQIEKYNELLGKIGKGSKDAEEAMTKLKFANENTRFGDYIKQLGDSEASIDGFIASINKTTVASKLAAGGMKLLAGAANTLIGAFAAMAINAVVNGLVEIATSTEKIAEAGRAAATTYQEQTTSLEDYRSRVEELNEQLASGDLGYEESKQARIELLDIQSQMISQFGIEASSAGLVTDAINGQADAWERLGKQQYDAYIREIDATNNWSRFNPFGNQRNGVPFAGTSALNDARVFMENEHELTFPTFDLNDFSDIENYIDKNYELLDLYTQVQEAVSKEFPDAISENSVGGLELSLLPEELDDVNGKLQSVYGTISEVAHSIGEASGFSEQEISAVINSMQSGLDSQVATLTDKTAEYQSTYDQYLQGYIKYYSEFAEEYKNVEEAYRRYSDALAANDEAEIDTARASLESVWDDAVSAINASSMDDAIKANFIDAFEGIAPDLSSLIDEWDFADLLKSSLSGTLKSLDGIDENELLDALLDGGESTIKSAYDRIASLATELQIIPEGSEYEFESIQALIDILVELGYVSGVTENTIQQLSTEFNIVAETAQSAIDEATLLTEALNSQTTGQGVTLENFEALIAANENYADALEYSNGVMQINADRAREIANQDISEQIAKATTEMKLQAQELRNTESSLENYRERLAKLQQQQELGFVVNQDTIDALKSSIASYEESSATIQENIAKYSVLISNLREATSAYQLWQDAQNAPESGDMYDDTLSALQQINEGLESGKVGTQKFEASVEFLIPDDVSRDNAEAIEDYKENVLDRYITFDEESGELIADGVANFTNDALNKGLASVDENGDWQVNSGVVMQDFVDKMHLTPEMVRAIFGELEEYGFEFAWDDEFRESMELTEEEVTQYKDKINQTLSEIGTDPIDIQANVSEITQAEADLYDLENYDVPGLIELPINVKANLQIQSDIEEKQSEIEALKAGLLNEDGTINLEVQAEISQAETDLAILQARLAALEQPTQVEIELATATIDEQIANLQLQLEGLDPKSETFELDTQNIQGQIDALEQTKIDIQSGLTTTEFDENASAVESKIDELSEKEATPRVRLVGHTTAIANINSVAAAISGLPRERTISIKTRYDPSGAIAAGLSSVVSAGGSAGAFGTATTGYAYANGEWGISHAQKALVGELGRELVVDPYSGKWKTVGDFGAEIVDLPKGAIVFNHLQTEEILKKGYVHGRGTALASGNAFVTGGGNLGNIQVGQGITDWDTGYIPGANAATNATNNYTNAVKDAASATSDASEEVEEYISDLWELYEVETKLADIQADSDILETQLDMADSANKAIGIQEKLLDQYEAEQEALHNLVEARRELIQEDIATLRDQGFIINYDPEQNNLFIENTEHVNDLMGATQEETNDLRKEMEELINSIIDMNDANQESGKSWWDLAQNIQQVKEELAENATSIFDDFIEYMDAFELWADSGINRVAALSQKQAELNRLYEEGYLTIQAYREQSFDLQQEIYEEQRDSITEIIELTEEMIKQEVEDQIDALEKQIEAYRELIDLRKEALEENKRENDHQDEINEKLEEMAKLRQQIDRLNLAAQSGDRAAAAEKAALDEQYAELQKELVDMQADYSYDTQQDALDKEMEAFEEQKNEEIKKLEESIDTEVKLYNLAIARINEGWDKLYQDLISYNSKYGDAIDGEDSLKTAWENATEAVKDYAYNVEAALQGIKTEGSFGNIQTNRVNELINQMKANGQGWANATTQAEKDRYEAANEALAKQLSVELGRPVVKGYDGEWYLDKVGGQKLYDVYPGGTTSRPSTEDDANKENATEAKVRELVRNMRANGSKYANATSDAEREVYAAANRQIAQQVSSLIGQPVVIGDDGVWYIGAVGRRKLYDVYHKGGIVGNAGTLKDNEMFTVLEKGEFVLSDSQKKTLFDLIGVAKNLNDIPTNKLVASRGIETRDFGGDNFQADFDIDFNVSGELDTNSARKFADMFADYAISKMQKGFSKSGIFNGRTVFGKA